MMMTVLIVAAMFLVIAFWALSSLSRSVMKAKGRSKCVYCKKRLKKVPAGYAEHCKACGRPQPWATAKTR